jgi:putative colanic acid biosysnthesis UDP-glucose lipid carrier transferase
MNKHFLRALQINLAIMDFTFINAMFFACEFIFRKHGWIGSEIEYMYFGFLISAAWLFVVLAMGIYSDMYILSFESFTKRTIQGFVVFLLLITVTLFFFRILVLSRIFLIIVLSLVFAILIVNRFIYLGFYQYFRGKEWLVNKVVILGYNDLSKKLADYLEEDGINKEVVGFLEEPSNVKELSRHPILGNVSETIDICKRYDVSEIYSTIDPDQDSSLGNLVQLADQNCIRFKLVPNLRHFGNGRIYVDYLNEIPILNLRNEPLEDLGNRIQKRAFDIVVSSLVIVFILSWLVPLIGLLIKLESKGPIFFAQRRSGKDNKPFYCLKFRSMQVNEKANLQQATKDDKRITKIGKFLRRTSLDEFPQFINVLKGQMSIVGPRPHMLKHTEDYSQQIDQYMIRHLMKPGITGWAQVHGYRGETQTLSQMQKRVEHDLWYLENWNLLVDIRIMFMTAFNTLKGDKNAF